MKQMQDGAFFDHVYFGHGEGERKSNYPLIGGYKHTTGSPDQTAAWVLKNLEEAYPDLKVVPPAEGITIVGKAPKVLEVGCATGAAVYEMRKLGIRAYGCDISEYILSQAMEEVKQFLYLGDIRYIADSKVTKFAPFDAVVSKDVLEHTTPDLIDGILLALSALAPVQFHIVNTGENERQAFNGDKTHNIRLTQKEWEAKAESLGLKIVFKPTE